MNKYEYLQNASLEEMAYYINGLLNWAEDSMMQHLAKDEINISIIRPPLSIQVNEVAKMLQEEWENEAE